MRKSFQDVKVWLMAHLLEQYGNDETIDPFENDMIETETITSIWNDVSNHLEIPYTLQLTINNSEDRYEVMGSKYVMFDENDIPFFAIPFNEVVGVMKTGYAGLQPEGMEKLLTAAYARMDAQLPVAIVEVSGGNADVTQDVTTATVIIIDHDNLQENIADNLRDFDKTLNLDASVDTASAIYDKVVECIKQRAGDSLWDIVADVYAAEKEEAVCAGCEQPIDPKNNSGFCSDTCRWEKDGISEEAIEGA